jgi:hypothetical protein
VYRWWLLKEAAILTINPLSEISLLLPHRLMPDEKTQLSPIKPISPLQDMPHVNMCKPVFIQRMRSSKGPRGTKETRREKPSLTGGRSRWHRDWERLFIWTRDGGREGSQFVSWPADN